MYYNSSCCSLNNRWPLADDLADGCYNSQASTYRANHTMPEQVAYSQSEATSSSSTTQEINTANDLARL